MGQIEVKLSYRYVSVNIAFPSIRETIGARNHRPMHDGRKNGSFSAKFKISPLQCFADRSLDSGTLFLCLGVGSQETFWQGLLKVLVIVNNLRDKAAYGNTESVRYIMMLVSINSVLPEIAFSKSVNNS